MADKSIPDLNEATQLFDNGLMVVYQSGETKKMQGQALKQYINAVADVDAAKAAANRAEAAAQDAERASVNTPYVGANGNWFVFDNSIKSYKDSGVDASITVSVADVTMLDYGSEPYVTNTGTATDPVFHLFIPNAAQGEKGNGIKRIYESRRTVSIDGNDNSTEYTVEFDDGAEFKYVVKDGQTGPVGPRGPNGLDGPSGFSPEAKVERVSDGAIITITDARGTTTAKIKDGQGGGQTATVTVTAPGGSAVSLTNGTESLTAQEVNGVWTFTGVPFGLWVATAEMENSTRTKDLSVVGDISIKFTDADPHTVILLKGDSLADESNNEIALTVDGTVVANNRDISKFGGGSIHINSSKISGYFPALAGDFTVEFWAYDFARAQYATPFSMAESNTYVHIGSSEFVLRVEKPTRAETKPGVAAEPPLKTWYHYALVRSGNSVTLYIDGVAKCTVSNAPSSNNYFMIGALSYQSTSSQTYYNGYIESFRISDVARYTEDFTPPDYCLDK